MVCHADPLAPGVAVGWPSHARVVDGVADGAGYVDFGQEDWDDEAYSGDESNPAKRAKQGAKARGVFKREALSLGGRYYFEERPGAEESSYTGSSCFSTPEANSKAIP